MREIGHRPQGGPSGSMSGMWKRSMVAILRHSQTKGRANREHKPQPKPPRHISTLPPHRSNCDAMINATAVIILIARHSSPARSQRVGCDAEVDNSGGRYSTSLRAQD